MKGNHFGPAELKQTLPIPIVVDNFVCGVCGHKLGAVAWTVVSTPRRKGIIVFACKEHTGPAMNILAKLLDTHVMAPDDLKLPDEEHN